MKFNIELIKLAFENHFGYLPTIIASSPGRINLIGEHTDYTGGYVLPAAINKSIIVAASIRNNNDVELISLDNNEFYQFNLNSFACIPNNDPLKWANYIMGVVDQLKKRGLVFTGFNLVIKGNIPIGAGMSSSAALSCSVVFALNELFQLKITKLAMVLIAQSCENEFIGLKCGIMDPFASMFGKKDQLIKLNCNKLFYDYIPFNGNGVKIILMDTKVKHSLASSAYNKRREECEEGFAFIKKRFPEVETLSNSNLQMLVEAVDSRLKNIFNRCKYVIEENSRILNACLDLKKGDMKTIGMRMYQTHYGLKDLYEVSCNELDFIVSSCKNMNEVLGARMMGGGFGGSVIALIDEQGADKIIGEIQSKYYDKFNVSMGVIDVVLSDGTSIVN